MKSDAGELSILTSQLRSYFVDRLILSSNYPWDLMLMHSIKSFVSWRQFTCSLSSDAPSVPYTLVCAFFCHGFGGTHLRDWSMGQAPSLYKNPDLFKAWFLAYALVYHSPFDLLYSLANTPRTFSSLLLSVFEAIDSATTICGSAEKGRQLFPESPAAPSIAALVAGVGGSVFRYCERRIGREMKEVETEWASPTETLRRTLVYIAAYEAARRMYGLHKARLYVTLVHVTWTLAKEITGAQLDFTHGFL